MNNIILRQITKIITPCIQLFGIYVILNGHISPGGGFAGGTIMASSFILLHITHGKIYVENIFSFEKALRLISVSLILYGLIKGYSFLSYDLHLPHPPTGIPGHILSGGFILPLNILVGITVTSTIYILYSLFADD